MSDDATRAAFSRLELSQHRYGKSRVRLLRVTRHAAYHDLDDWTVEIMLTGDFAEVFTHGDNSRILATDTMKNTVYFLARRSEANSMETFAQELSEFLLSRNPQVTRAEVAIRSHLWKRLTVEGEPYPTAFMKGSDEQQTTRISQTRSGPLFVRSGFDNMTLLKTAGSSFAGFLRDELTTLPETSDRLLGTSVTAEWSYSPASLASVDFNALRAELRERMISTFARHDSLSVQQTLYAMAEGTLQHSAAVGEVSLRMPNKHNLLVDLQRFGVDNPNHIFVPTDEPHGTIEATVRRA